MSGVDDGWVFEVAGGPPWAVDTQGGRAGTYLGDGRVRIDRRLRCARSDELVWLADGEGFRPIVVGWTDDMCQPGVGGAHVRGAGWLIAGLLAVVVIPVLAFRCIMCSRRHRREAERYVDGRLYDEVTQHDPDEVFDFERGSDTGTDSDSDRPWSPPSVGEEDTDGLVTTIKVGRAGRARGGSTELAPLDLCSDS